MRINTAPAYGFGHSEEIVGKALAGQGRRDKAVLATPFQHLILVGG
jgi:aryl-alcohol dehydrogenase-like predicted oxidoreductase